MHDVPDLDSSRSSLRSSELVRDCYHELRRLASSYFHRFPSRTLQPTVLLHEAYLRLCGAERRAGDNTQLWADRGHFLAVAATAMRQVLVDHARSKATLKRGSQGIRIEFHELESSARPVSVFDVIALGEALDDLASVDPRASRLIELRFMAGLSVDEAAEVLGVSRSTAENDWRAARAWLMARLDPCETDDDKQ